MAVIIDIDKFVIPKDCRHCCFCTGYTEGGADGIKCDLLRYKYGVEHFERYTEWGLGSYDGYKFNGCPLREVKGEVK